MRAEAALPAGAVYHGCICSLLDSPCSQIPLFPDAQGCPIPSPGWAHCSLSGLSLSRALACLSITQKPSHGTLLVPLRHRSPVQPNSPGNSHLEEKEGQETQAEHSKTLVLDHFTCFEVTLDGHLQKNSSQVPTSDGAELQQQVKEKPPRVAATAPLGSSPESFPSGQTLGSFLMPSQ